MSTRWLQVWCAILGLTLIAGAAALYLPLAALPSELRPEYRNLLAEGQTLLVIAAILAAVLAGMLAQWVVRTYFAPVRRHAELARLIASSNPDFRFAHEPGMPAELRDLAQAINQLAERNLQHLRAVQDRVRDANADLLRERSQLAALLSDLAQSVLVCNAEGRVMLYNERARRRLHGAGTSGLLGLGRSLYDLLDRATLEREYAGLRERLAQGEVQPVRTFDIQLPDGHGAQARMAPVKPESPGEHVPAAADGYVLLLSETMDTDAPPPVPEQAAHLAGRPVYYDFDLFHQPGQTREIDDRPLRELAYTVFDTETTGLNPAAGDEIIAIGAIRIVNGRLLSNEVFEQLVDPQRGISADSIRVHGMTPDRLAGKPLIDTVLPVFHRFCEGTVLVGHNAAFDMRFLELKAQSSGVRFTAPVLDTLLLSSALHGDMLEHHLEGIAARLGVEAVDRHTALGDAITTARVFLKLLALLADRGITTLRQAREAAAQTVHARIRY